MVRTNNRDNGDSRGRRFFVFGRALPTEENPNPEIVVVRVYARNSVFAKSKFWKTNRVINKVKKSQGEVLKIQEIFDQGKISARNYGIFLKYRSRTGVHNCYKEYRAVNLKSAINQMYNEMGGNYKCNSERVEIIRTVELKENELKLRNPRCKQWIDTENIMYPLWKKNTRPTNTRYRAIFKANRPVCIQTPVTVNK